VNYGHNYGGLDSTHALPPWDAPAAAGRRAVLLQQIEGAASGAHGSVPRGPAAASADEAEANWWGLADLWEEDLMAELRRRAQQQQQQQQPPPPRQQQQPPPQQQQQRQEEL
jgi:hypothetical protein